jgi:hypothetical protein
MVQIHTTEIQYSLDNINTCRGFTEPRQIFVYDKYLWSDGVYVFKVGEELFQYIQILG